MNFESNFIHHCSFAFDGKLFQLSSNIFFWTVYFEKMTFSLRKDESLIRRTKIVFTKTLLQNSIFVVAASSDGSTLRQNKDSLWLLQHFTCDN